MPEKFIQKDYINPEYIPISNRGLDKYFSDLNLNKEMLAGKRVLDLGSGTGRFAKEIKEKGISSEIISLDPVFANPSEKAEKGAPEIPDELYVNRPRDKKVVAAVGENLPFKENSFDFVLAEYSLPAHATSKQQIDEFFSDTLKALRINGELRYMPPVSLQSKELSEYIDNKLTELSHQDSFEVIKAEQLTIIKKLK